MAKILLAGDGFIRNEVLREAVLRHVPDAELSYVETGWPVVPWGSPGDVREASGDEAELSAALAGIDACITHTAAFTSTVLRQNPGLKLLTVCRGGPVNASVATATELGIPVTFTPGRNAVATAEHTLALILGAARQIAQRHGELMAGQWRGDYYRYEDVGPEISGSTVGLVGYGAVGSRVARALVAMGAHVLVYDPYVDPATLEAGVELVPELDSLLERSSVLTLHARLTEENAGMIGREQLARLPAGAILVNAARGGLLDYDAACEALASRHLYAAGFDVLPSEPLAADSPLRRVPNVTMTPHLAGASRQAAHFAAEVGATDIARFLAGQRPLHLANPEVFGPAT